MIAKILRYWSYFLRILPYIFIFFPVLVYSWFVKNRPRYQGLWLISERGDEARDNGYHLYRYIREMHPEINVYFVLSSESPDRDKIVKLGRETIEPKSPKHFLYYILAEKVISTHLHGAAPYGKAVLPFLKFMPKKKHVMLKHGVTKDNFAFKDNYIDLLVCVSRFELECLKNSSPKIKDAIQILGFCRYDKLIDKSSEERIILFMPTFRKWLEDLSRLPNRDKYFTQDSYFTHWNSLLNNRKLIEILEEKNLKLVFYPHYRIQKYIHNFHSISNNVVIADNKKFDIQELLTKSSLMVTDFSSVFFDFVYMKKPVIYYQFDKEDYRKKHYKEGAFSYELHGFGPVLNTEQEVVDYIQHVIDNNFEMDSMYSDRLEGFFEFRDNKNSERNFRAILEL